MQRYEIILNHMQYSKYIRIFAEERLATETLRQKASKAAGFPAGLARISGKGGRI